MSIVLVLPQRHTRWNADATDKACLHIVLCKGSAHFSSAASNWDMMPCSASEASWLAGSTFMLILCCLI